MKLPLLNIDGSKNSSIEISDKLVRQKINYKLIKFVIDWQLNHAKPRTAKTKQRNEIKGSTKKIIAQKGSGGARHASKKAPLFVGGGVAHGPKGFVYKKKKINKKMFKNGIKSILSKLAKEERIIMVKDFSLDEPKTKKLLELISPFETSSITIILDEISENLHLASRNLKNIDITTADQINPVDLISHEKILLTDKSLEKIIGAYS